MARHAQPREVAKLKGSVKKNPKRYKSEEEKPKHASPLGEPPKGMSKEAKKAWKELVDQALPGVLTKSDRFVMEVGANLLAEYRAAPLEFAATKYTHLLGVMGRLGLSPADRQKINLPRNPHPDDPFEQFFQMNRPKPAGKGDA